MKKSEKLLDAIGQIDDRLVEEAAEAGAAPADIMMKNEKKKKKRKKAALYRWQGALAACAVMAVCIGIFALLERSGMLLWPFGASSSQAPTEMEEAAMEDAADQEAEMEEAGTKDPEMNGAAAENVVTAGEPEALMGSFAAEEGKEALETAKVAEDQQEVQQSGRSADGGISQEYAEGAASEDVSMSDDVVITVTESGAESVTFTLEYKASDTICFGEAYELEQYAEGIWQTVQPKTEVCWKEPLYTVGDGGSFHQTVKFGTIYGTLAPGQYRLVKYYEREAGKEPEGQETYPMYVEFTVSE